MISFRDNSHTSANRGQSSQALHMQIGTQTVDTSIGSSLVRPQNLINHLIIWYDFRITFISPPVDQQSQSKHAPNSLRNGKRLTSIFQVVMLFDSSKLVIYALYTPITIYYDGMERCCLGLDTWPWTTTVIYLPPSPPLSSYSTNGQEFRKWCVKFWQNKRFSVVFLKEREGLFQCFRALT